MVKKALVPCFAQGTRTSRGATLIDGNFSAHFSVVNETIRCKNTPFLGVLPSVSQAGSSLASPP
ncbi:MAG: hypothetical protein P4L49_00600 [Desulfosporosinus sp.]|nr:hypothetical protein [Desulfosporosinus sp.]